MFKYTEWLKKQEVGKNGFSLIWNENIQTEAHAEKLKKCIEVFILEVKLDQWAKEILEQHFLFTEDVEQRAIIDIIHSMLEGEREGLRSMTEHLFLKGSLQTSITNFLAEEASSFSFNSFVQFRLRSFMEKLTQYIELAIDEYKMEQEYQVFIQTLREFLQSKSAKVETIHLLVDLDIQLFDNAFREITQKDLLKVYDQKLISYHAFYIDPGSLGPLLSLAPKTIYLYTEDRDQPIVRTIVNIFEERVRIMEKEAFYENSLLNHK